MLSGPLDAARPRATGEVISGGIELFDRLAPEWRALCDEGPSDEPFFRPEWIRAYVRAFTPESTVVIATARLEGRLIGVLPLIREVGTLGGVPARKLRSAGNVHTCRYDLVHGKTGAEEAIAAIWLALSETPGWDLLEMRSVPRGGAAGRLCRLAKAQGSRVRVKRAPSSPYVTLSGVAGAYDAVLQRVDGKFRANLRRRRRKLEAKGPVSLLRTGKADAQLERFYRLERQGWKGKEASAIACSPETRTFYDEVATEAERCGELSLYSLQCGDAPVAMQLGLTRHHRYFILKTAYDESLRDCSPGQLLTQEVFRDLTAHDCVELDFLGISMDWKQDWAPRLRSHANWYVFRGGAGRVLEALRFHVLPPIARVLRRADRSTPARASNAVDGAKPNG